MQQNRLNKSEDEWKGELTESQYDVLRRCGTEPAFSGAYWNTKDKGMYLCAGCGQELFSSDTKFDSGTGWPSFWQPVTKDVVEAKEDASLGMARTEIRCSRCGGHLGHVFNDGPRETTGQRYCINSSALRLKKAE